MATKKRPTRAEVEDAAINAAAAHLALTPTDDTIRAAVRALIDALFLDRMHPMAREGLRREFPALLGLIPGVTSTAVVRIWQEEARL